MLTDIFNSANHDLFTVVQQLSIMVFTYVGITYLLIQLFLQLFNISFVRLYRDKRFIFLLGLLLSVIGHEFSVLYAQGMISTRAIGVIIAGLLGGPVVGVLVAAVAGIYYSVDVGGMFTQPVMLASLVDGLTAGLVSYYCMRSHQRQWLLQARYILCTSLGFSMMHVLAITVFSIITTDVVSSIHYFIVSDSLMLLVNALGVFLLLYLLQTFRVTLRSYSEKSLIIAKDLVENLALSPSADSRQSFLQVIQQRTGVDAVIMLPSRAVDSAEMYVHRKSKLKPLFNAHNNDAADVIAAIEAQTALQNQMHPLIKIDLADEQHHFGQLVFIESNQGLMPLVDESLASIIAAIAAQHLSHLQKLQNDKLQSETELKLLKAQVDTHFLFNALNTIYFTANKDTELSRQLIMDLSNLMRMNLQRPSELCTLRQELEHVNRYLRIEQTRFQNHLQVEQRIELDVDSVNLPTFSLQTLVENAIKHGISQNINGGKITIHCYQQDGDVYLNVHDSANMLAQTAYHAPEHNVSDSSSVVSPGQGLGLSLVRDRLQQYLSVDSELQLFSANQHTTSRVVIKSAG